jgi:hypothetical protein
MSEQEGDDGQVAQRRDAILRKLLQTPPQSRAETIERVWRAKERKATHLKRKSQQAKSA